MKRLMIAICIACALFGCKSSKQSKKTSTNRTVVTKQPSKTVITTKKSKDNTVGYPDINGGFGDRSSAVLAEKIIDEATRYKGVRYKYGGNTKKGMDCSGLITMAFSDGGGIILPRSSSAMSTSGDWIDLKKVQRGDLLFFATNGKKRTINHVGLVTYADNGNVEFIHSTTNAGVIVSSLEERYWYFAFVQARRVL
ncbi:MAG TPA: NlpC/P60 family protein [Aquaticitalea sp.]|nr:NlpC/P60 family protein [Aquaticitalea sp.]HNU59823.1 NlpC/P60 family protein [Aquaticitalea sp.]